MLHSLVIAAMLFVLPAFIFFQGVIDPTTIDGPGPGDGGIVLLYLAMLLHLAMLLPSAIAYAIIARASYRERKRGELSSLPAN